MNQSLNSDVDWSAPPEPGWHVVGRPIVDSANLAARRRPGWFVITGGLPRADQHIGNLLASSISLVGAVDPDRQVKPERQGSRSVPVIGSGGRAQPLNGLEDMS